MSDTRIADEVTTQAMVAQYDTTLAGYDAAIKAVTGSGDSLASAWQSDKAAPAFQNALSSWLDGVVQVKRGLDMLNGAMNGYRQNTIAVEDDSTPMAGGWANG